MKLIQTRFSSADLKLLRKLGYNEIVMINNCKNRDLQMIFSLFIESKFNLFKDLELLKKAICTCRAQHLFLRCKVVDIKGIQ